MVADLAGALTQARRNGVHDRVTVDNVVIDSKGRAHLREFGLRFADANDLTELGAAGGDSTRDQPDLARRARVRHHWRFSARRRRRSHSMVDVIGRAASPGNGLPRPRLVRGCRAVGGRIGDTRQRRPVPATPTRDCVHLRSPTQPTSSGGSASWSGCWRRLGETGIRGRFVVLVGPSGSGKSSVVKAGLLAALRRGPCPGPPSGSSPRMTPGKHPFEELETALLRVAVNPPPSLLEQLTDGESGIRRAVRRVLPDDQSQLLVVIDQFEELFTQTPDATTQEFLEALAAAVDDPGAGFGSWQPCAPTSTTAPSAIATSASWSAAGPR